MIYLVTGPPRSGTSLVMQVMRALGVQCYGLQFPPHRDRMWNTRGYFEDVDLLSGDLRGIRCFDYDVAGKVIIERFPFADGPSVFTVVCKRDVSAIVDSQIAMGIEHDRARALRAVEDAYREFDDRHTGERLDIRHEAARSPGESEAEFRRLAEMVGVPPEAVREVTK